MKTVFKDKTQQGLLLTRFLRGATLMRAHWVYGAFIIVSSQVVWGAEEPRDRYISDAVKAYCELNDSGPNSTAKATDNLNQARNSLVGHTNSNTPWAKAHSELKTARENREKAAQELSDASVKLKSAQGNLARINAPDPLTNQSQTQTNPSGRTHSNSGGETSYQGAQELSNQQLTDEVNRANQVLDSATAALNAANEKLTQSETAENNAFKEQFKKEINDCKPDFNKMNDEQLKEYIKNNRANSESPLRKGEGNAWHHLGQQANLEEARKELEKRNAKKKEEQERAQAQRPQNPTPPNDQSVGDLVQRAERIANGNSWARTAGSVAAAANVPGAGVVAGAAQMANRAVNFAGLNSSDQKRLTAILQANQDAANQGLTSVRAMNGNNGFVYQSRTNTQFPDRIDTAHTFDSSGNTMRMQFQNYVRGADGITYARYSGPNNSSQFIRVQGSDRNNMAVASGASFISFLPQSSRILPAGQAQTGFRSTPISRRYFKLRR